MIHSPRALALLAQITRGLLLHGADQTARHLGDRSTYVGLSDVGKAITCLRSAVAGKIAGASTNADDVLTWLQNGKSQPIADTLSRQLILQRGHWLEAGLEGALRANGATLIPQLEIRTPQHPVPIRAHLDFALLRGGSTPAVRVLELKSTRHLPQTLSSAYEAQLYGQIGLLKEFWAEPTFSVRDETGKVVVENHTFPALCQALFGIAMPTDSDAVDIEGWLLCLSMTEARPFGPYRPDRAMLSLCRRTAERLWQTVQAVKAGRMTLDQVETCFGFQPLCQWCDHAENCPKFQADPVNDPALDRTLGDYVRLKMEKAKREADLDALEDQIRTYCRHGKSTWLQTSQYRFRTAQIPGRKSIDQGRLRAQLTNRLGEAEADALLADITFIGSAYERLIVTPIKSPHQHEEPSP